ncbi:basic proline-rich protein-like [Cervus canadensis]|uniref:basic proline-rich protein-like n=1 Tax=Cervus canadensis TaxID=1574408 RepID=UPI001CA359E7|nr:basic proline-rich protein-like [Cervus canadensis]
MGASPCTGPTAPGGSPPTPDDQPPHVPRSPRNGAELSSPRPPPPRTPRPPSREPRPTLFPRPPGPPPNPRPRSRAPFPPTTTEGRREGAPTGSVAPSGQGGTHDSDPVQGRRREATGEGERPPRRGAANPSRRTARETRPEDPQRAVPQAGGERKAVVAGAAGEGSPTETLLRLLLPLDSQVRPSSQRSARAVGRPRRGRSEGLTKPSNRCPAGHGNNAAASPVGIVYGRNYDGGVVVARDAGELWQRASPEDPARRGSGEKGVWSGRRPPDPPAPHPRRGCPIAHTTLGPRGTQRAAPAATAWRNEGRGAAGPPPPPHPHPPRREPARPGGPGSRAGDPRPGHAGAGRRALKRPSVPPTPEGRGTPGGEDAATGPREADRVQSTECY